MIKGFFPCSLIDWPGKLAAVLFLGGCNWKCPHCHNPVLAWEPNKLPAVNRAQIMKHLENKLGWLDGVVITGGEPTIHHRDLSELCRDIKKRGLAVKLDTNGSYPVHVRYLIDAGLVDCVAMDIKAPMRLYDQVAGIKVIAKHIEASIQLLKNHRPDLEVIFRTTLIPGLVGDEEVKEIAEWLGEKPIIQPFNTLSIKGRTS